ncbi:OmpA family protein [Wenjunlia tyrosinilytica]|nr:OmpA family protein [Wenjunlia tyrosinilytica]
MTPKPRRLTAGAVVAAAGLILLWAHPAAADGPTPSAAPSAPVEVDGQDSDLQLAKDAQLAPPKVLDIKTVIEDGGGNERRSETNKDVTFALQTEVLFSKDSAELSPAAMNRIKAIANEIDDQEAKHVRVFGFTDDLGSSSHGDVLSKRRAESVRQALSRNLAPGVTYDVRGYGEDYPIADNSTEEGRRKNRRVEITFPKTED